MRISKVHILGLSFVFGAIFSMLLQPGFVFTLMKNKSDAETNKNLGCKRLGFVPRMIHALLGGLMVLITALTVDKLLVNPARIYSQQQYPGA